MPSNTVFNPVNISSFEKTKMSKNAVGIQQTVPSGTTTNIDFDVTDDILIYGGHTLLVSGAVLGDKASFSIVMGTTVVSQFVTDWYINPESLLQSLPHANYPAKIPAGFKMRFTYTSTGESDVWIAINYNLEKVLE